MPQAVVRKDKFNFTTAEILVRDQIAGLVETHGIARVVEMLSDIALEDARQGKRNGNEEAKTGHAAIARTLEVVAKGIDQVHPG